MRELENIMRLLAKEATVLDADSVSFSLKEELRVPRATNKDSGKSFFGVPLELPGDLGSVFVLGSGENPFFKLSKLPMLVLNRIKNVDRNLVFTMFVNSENFKILKDFGGLNMLSSSQHAFTHKKHLFIL